MSKKKLKKQVGLYEVENVSNGNILTIAVNPKGYFEKYKDYSVNKKHKGVRRNTPGMDFEAYSVRICSLHEFCQQNKSKKIEQKRFQIINDSMQMRSVKKNSICWIKRQAFLLPWWNTFTPIWTRTRKNKNKDLTFIIKFTKKKLNF